MTHFELNCKGYDLLGENGSDGLRYAWKYESSDYLVESAAFPHNSKLVQIPGVCGYTSSVSSGCFLKKNNIECQFCRTGKMIPFGGLLNAFDIAKQNIFMVLTDIYCDDHPELRANAREFAYMGQGEPGYSYSQIQDAIRITNKVMYNDLHQKVYRHILATSGVPSLIKSYINDLKNNAFDSRVTMHFSLHATEDRSMLMPINTKHSYKETLKLLPEIFSLTGEKPCIGIMLFRDFSPKGQNYCYSNNLITMDKIAEEIDPKTMRVSLCEYNESMDIGSSKSWNYEESMELMKVFEDRGIEVKMFSSFGREKNAACGTLGGKKPDYVISEKWKRLEKEAEELIKKYL